MHRLRFRSLDKIRAVAVSDEQVLQLFSADARQHRGIGNLVAVQMQNGQYGAIGDWVEKFVRMPCGRQWARLGFTVPDNASDDQIGMVEGGAERVRQGVAKLASLMNGAWSLGSYVAGNSPWKRKLF